MLDLISKTLTDEGLSYYTIKGDVTPKKRAEMVQEFNTKRDSAQVRRSVHQDSSWVKDCNLTQMTSSTGLPWVELVRTNTRCEPRKREWFALIRINSVRIGRCALSGDLPYGNT